MTYIQIIDMATGRTERLTRDELSHADVEQAAADLCRAIAWAGDRTPVSPGISIGVIPAGRCTSITIYGTTRYGDRIVARIGIATHSRCAKRLWDMLASVGPLVPVNAERPGQPWCAVQLHPQAADHETILHISRALAWAWLERTQETQP